ncbi:hypothetical protein KAR91_42465 [Candidatus Pacearchaeota archaeon]|nr:hypothetical protein [Candidatus Pacearchaeota archaeon]
MTRFERLRKEALAACRRWGHKMQLSRHTILEGRHRATWHCLTCNMCVTVDTLPDPNGIDIGGEAVALECGE